MIKIATAALGFGLAAVSGQTAQAQYTYSDNYPICLQVYTPVVFTECSYTSIPQCRASASGRAATCIVNPFFDPGQPPRRRRR